MLNESVGFHFHQSICITVDIYAVPAVSLQTVNKNTFNASMFRHSVDPRSPLYNINSTIYSTGEHLYIAFLIQCLNLTGFKCTWSNIHYGFGQWDQRFTALSTDSVWGDYYDPY